MQVGAAEPSPPLSIMDVPDVEYIVPPPGYEHGLHTPQSPRTFRRHKNLPHARLSSGSATGSYGTPDSRRSSSGSQSLHTLRHQRRRISGGELPPTPPAHSRTSSSSKSINLANISPIQTPAQSTEDVQTQASPSTPLNQRSPPTPEVTPPRPITRSRLASQRPAIPHRIPSKSTTTDSRSESFRTALESPELSEDDGDDSNLTLRNTTSAGTSEVTVRQQQGEETRSISRARLSSGTGSKHEEDEHSLTPKAAKGAFQAFDGEWGADGEVEQVWDDNLARTVTVTKRCRNSPRAGRYRRQETLDDRTVSPTNATKAVRSLPLQGRILTYESPETARSFTAPEPAASKTPTRPDSRRFSGMSTKSTASSTVEAILVATPTTARRNRTLRHVKRVDALRDAVWQPSPFSSVPSVESASQSRRMIRPSDGPRESYASNSTVASMASRKARKEVWKSGGIPVVVVPDRHSSTRDSSQDRSAPSIKSQRSKRSQSISSTPLSQVPKTHDLTPYFERPSRHSRRTSESDSSTPGDQRTIDFPPTIPRRTSSLSAPTSRNGSRRASINESAGSLTAESLKAHNESVVAHGTVQISKGPTAGAEDIPAEASVPIVMIDSRPSYSDLRSSGHRSEAGDYKRRTFESHLGSPLSPTQTTPFSQISAETSEVNAEISQALAMSIDRHQNRSVLMVDHRPSESSDGERRPERPMITTTNASGPVITTEEIDDQGEPITPPQAHPYFSLNELDSPLRNPRAPPEPPVLQFSPATPSGLTPAEERPRLLGNFYDEVEEEEEEKAPRGLAMVRRALNKRRNSYGPSPSRERPSFLTRTFSSSRNIRRETAENPETDPFGPASPNDPHYDESHLHPDWRPSYFPGAYDDGVYDVDDGGEGEDLRYPIIDNRPRPPKRSLSQRMKHTFAIMPARDTNKYRDEYMHDNEPERRTIRRDPGGSLRVVKKRGSVGSLRERKTKTKESQRTPIFPRNLKSLAKLRRRDSQDSDAESTTSNYSLKRSWSLTQGLSRRASEKRREKRSDELRSKISAPRDCRDGVQDVIRRDGLRAAYEAPRQVYHL